MIRCKGSTDSGITLIELMITISLAAFIGLGLYNLLCSGIDLWTWQSENVMQGDMMLFFDKVAEDVHNGMDLTGEVFDGDSNGFSFWEHNTSLLISDVSDMLYSGIPVSEAISWVQYEYDMDNEVVLRRSRGYGAGIFDVDEKVVLRGVVNFEVFFLERGASGAELVSNDIFKGRLPEALDVRVTLKDEHGDEQVYRKIIEFAPRF